MRVIPWTIDLTLYREGKERAEKMPPKMAGDIGEDMMPKRIVGSICELVYIRIYPDAKLGEKYGDDIIHDGKRIEVKCTRRNFEPEPHYLGDVPDRSYKRQKPDLWCFFSSLKMDKVYLMGFCTHEFFDKNHKFREEGDIEPTRKGWTYPCDTRVIPYDELTEPKTRGKGEFWSLTKKHYDW